MRIGPRRAGSVSPRPRCAIWGTAVGCGETSRDEGDAGREYQCRSDIKAFDLSFVFAAVAYWRPGSIASACERWATSSS
jgi:hypothetical protein